MTDPGHTAVDAHISRRHSRLTCSGRGLPATEDTERQAPTKLVTTQTADEADTLTAPPHEGDDPWPFVLLHNDMDTTCADTATELVGVLIPGYDTIPADSDGDTPPRRMPTTTKRCGCFTARRWKR